MQCKPGDSKIPHLIMWATRMCKPTKLYFPVVLPLHRPSSDGSTWLEALYYKVNTRAPYSERAAAKCVSTTFIKYRRYEFFYNKLQVKTPAMDSYTPRVLESMHQPITGRTPTLSSALWGGSGQKSSSSFDLAKRNRGCAANSSRNSNFWEKIALNFH